MVVVVLLRALFELKGGYGEAHTFMGDPLGKLA